MDTADSRGPDTAERVFAEFLHRLDQGADLTVAGLIAAHPQLAERLRTLAANYAAGDPRVAPTDATERSQARARSELTRLLDRLRQRGPDGTRFQRLDRIGAGGMGEVWSARDDDLQREFALKQIGNKDGGAEAMHGPEGQLRFVAEAQTLGQLQHPGIPPLHELGVQPDGRLYFAMARVHGQPLTSLLGQRANWPLRRVLAIVQSVCETMAYAHGKNVIHRDLKPDNVMVGEFGEVYVIDWGLARAFGHPDPNAAVVRTVRTPSPNGAPATPAAATVAADEAGLTRHGTIVGTPNFMAPEQAAGDIAAVDKRSDIYSVGAMLYQLITGTLPYGEGKPDPIVAAVCKGPPKPVGSLAPNTPKDLLAICERAMARDPADRYPTMQDLATDLRHYLDGHAVKARRISQIARTWKWARRNRALTATGSLLAAALGFALMAMLWWYDSSTELQRILAQEDAKSSNPPPTPRLPDELAANISTLQLDSVQHTVDDLQREADDLWPAEPEQIPRLEQWVRRAQALLDGRQGDPGRGDLGQPGLTELRDRLATLRQRAKSPTDAERRHDETSHPRFAESERFRARVTWSARMLAKEPWPPAPPAALALGDGPVPDNCEDLRALAEHLGDPDAFPFDQVDRAVALIDRALPLATADERAVVLATQAMIRLKRGDLQGAEQAAAEATRVATETNRAIVTSRITTLRRQLADWTERRSDREKQHALWTSQAEQAEREVKTQRTYRFEVTADQRNHDQLATLVDSLAELTHPERGHLKEILIQGKGHSVAQRLKNARDIEQRTIHGPDAIRGWGIAIPAIQSSPHYSGLTIRPQLGLLPLGEDPESGLWVFWHLGSGNLPRKNADERWTPAMENGLTFVLVPGGRFHKGAQRGLSDGPGYDPDAARIEGPVEELEVAPFFLSKYELTQAQWWGFTGTQPSQYSLSGFDQRWNQRHQGWSALHPVERVSWNDCKQVLERNGLTMPTDTQWEYAYRAGTRTPYPTGADPRSLAGHGNLADRFGGSFGLTGCLPWLEDENAVTARIGSYRPNRWGLHDMVGNVAEWVLDVPAKGRSSSDQNPGEKRTRGGHWHSLADMPRCARWATTPADSRSPQLGVRPARAIDR
ncbi:MAG: SUMF1/EgtB/PvdO family nonheme iron enzyme [Planctomycetes bacterium]|nr:SUMF1/EgtB/PvdO family nonheme iron enzyme [Planctomycetota bacterium]